jgi:hypothetical protein
LDIHQPEIGSGKQHQLYHQHKNLNGEIEFVSLSKVFEIEGKPIDFYSFQKSTNRAIIGYISGDNEFSTTAIIVDLTTNEVLYRLEDIDNVYWGPADEANNQIYVRKRRESQEASKNSKQIYQIDDFQGVDYAIEIEAPSILPGIPSGMPNVTHTGVRTIFKENTRRGSVSWCFDSNDKMVILYDGRGEMEQKAQIFESDTHDYFYIIGNDNPEGVLKKQPKQENGLPVYNESESEIVAEGVLFDKKIHDVDFVKIKGVKIKGKDHLIIDFRSEFRSNISVIDLETKAVQVVTLPNYEYAFIDFEIIADDPEDMQIFMKSSTFYGSNPIFKLTQNSESQNWEAEPYYSQDAPGGVKESSILVRSHKVDADPNYPVIINGKQGYLPILTVENREKEADAIAVEVYGGFGNEMIPFYAGVQANTNLTERDTNFAILNVRGDGPWLGFNKIEFDRKETVADFTRSLEYLLEIYPDKKLNIHGMSNGGFIAILCLLKLIQTKNPILNNIHNVILHYPLASLKNYQIGALPSVTKSWERYLGDPEADWDKMQEADPFTIIEALKANGDLGLDFLDHKINVLILGAGADQRVPINIHALPLALDLADTLGSVLNVRYHSFGDAGHDKSPNRLSFEDHWNMALTQMTADAAKINLNID